MAKFFQNTNNGVVAVIREDHARLYGVIRRAGGSPPKGGAVKIFCFHSVEEGTLCHRAEFPDQYRTYTGSTDDLTWLISQGGHELVDVTEDSGWDGYIPFSNGFTISNEKEVDYVTHLSDVRNIFFT